jgi:hypothetical protein
MRIAVALAGLLMTASLAVPTYAAPDNNQQQRAPRASTTTTKRPPVVEPTWEQCFNMSVDRGFNHDIEEWWQAIDDCQQGKIPL